MSRIKYKRGVAVITKRTRTLGIIHKRFRHPHYAFQVWFGPENIWYLKKREITLAPDHLEKEIEELELKYLAENI